MALKNLFDMVKADRYTADGREAIIKAQEAETEDKVYQIGEISQKTGLQKTANGWVKPKNGKQPGAKKEEVNKSVTSKKDEIWKDMKKREDALRAKGMTSRHFMDDPEYAHLSELYKNEMEAESKPAVESIGRDEKLNKVRQVLNTALTPSGDKVQMTKSKVTGDFHVLLNGKSTGGGFRDPQKAKEEFNAWIAGKKTPSESAKERINKRFDESESRSQKAMESKPDESARIAASKETRAKKSQELEQKAAGDFAKYKDLPPVQRKDALGAASHEGISIGLTQRSMEGMGWDLIQADDKVNVYGKPDGSKATMKHDGKKITEVSYEGPENKPAAQDAAPRVLTGDTRIRVRK